MKRNSKMNTRPACMKHGRAVLYEYCMSFNEVMFALVVYQSL